MNALKGSQLKHRVQFTTPDIFYWSVWLVVDVSPVCYYIHFSTCYRLELQYQKFFVLAIINCGIVCMLSRQNHLRRIVLQNGANSDKDPSSTNRTSNTFLLSCVFLYIFTQFPNIIFRSLQIASSVPFLYLLLYIGQSKHISPDFQYVPVGQLFSELFHLLHRV